MARYRFRESGCFTYKIQTSEMLRGPSVAVKQTRVPFGNQSDGNPAEAGPELQLTRSSPALDIVQMPGPERPLPNAILWLSGDQAGETSVPPNVILTGSSPDAGTIQMLES